MTEKLCLLLLKGYGKHGTHLPVHIHIHTTYTISVTNSGREREKESDLTIHILKIKLSMSSVPNKYENELFETCIFHYFNGILRNNVASIMIVNII